MEAQVKMERWPDFVLRKLVQLDAEVRALHEGLSPIMDAIERHRGVLLDRRRAPSGLDDAADDARAALPALEDKQRELEHRISVVDSVASSCRAWLLALPAGTQLEPVSVDAKVPRSKTSAAASAHARARSGRSGARRCPRLTFVSAWKLRWRSLPAAA